MRTSSGSSGHAETRCPRDHWRAAYACAILIDGRWLPGELRSSMAARCAHERGKILRDDPDGIQDPDVRQLAARAEPVDGRGAHPNLARDGSDREEGTLDPGWTRRSVLLRCGMGDSWVCVCFGPE